MSGDRWEMAGFLSPLEGKTESRLAVKGRRGRMALEYIKHENLLPLKMAGLNLKGAECLCPWFFSWKVKPAQQ